MDINPDKLYLTNILEAIIAINDFVKHVGLLEFMESKLIYSAVIRQIEIIGEAAKHLSPEYKQAHSSIPWKQIIGTRDILIHDYLGVDLERVWTIVTDFLPQLQKEIDESLNSGPASPAGGL